MKLDKIAIILMLTLAIAMGAFYLSGQQSEKTADQEADRFFLPGLLTKINQVAQVVITDDAMTTHLLRKDDRWIVQEKANYDAEFFKVKSLLLGLAELKTVEAKTSKPENYGRLGVQGLGEAGEEASRQIQLHDKAGNLLYTLIIGKNKDSRVPGAKPAIYVRQLSEVKSWLVSGKIDIPGRQVDWLDKRIIDMDSSRIQSIEIRQPDNNQLVVSKQNKTDEDFTVQNLPANAVLNSNNVTNSLANALQNLSFDEVLKRGTFQANDKKITTTVFKTFDGLALMAKLFEKDETFFLWFDAKTASNDEKVKKESSELNAKFALWVYEIPSFKANTFNKTLADLIMLEEMEE